MLTTATVHSDIRSAAAVYADTCSLTLSALSPSRNLWDAIPRDIDTVRYGSAQEIESYCRTLADQAQQFSNEIRHLLDHKQLVVIDQIKQEVQGQKGRTNGLALRAAQRFPFAPSDLVRQSLTFQMAVHDHALAAESQYVERQLIDEIMRRTTVFWREEEARHGRQFVSLADKMLFSTAAANAIMIENGHREYGSVILVSRDLHHVYRMYHYREDILRPLCKRMRLLYPRNFLFRPTFQQVDRLGGLLPNALRIARQ